MPVSVAAGLLDRQSYAILAGAPEAALIAAIGMMISVGLVLAVLSGVFPEATLMSSVIDSVISAGLFLLLPMGVCSLLSHNYRVKVANPASSRHALS